jgi:hypothetical protein
MTATFRDIFMYVFECSLLDLFKEFSFTLGPERVVALKDDEHKHAQTPQVSVNWHMISFGYYFRSHVGGSSTESVNCGWWY